MSRQGETAGNAADGAHGDGHGTTKRWQHRPAFVYVTRSDRAQAEVSTGWAAARIEAINKKAGDGKKYTYGEFYDTDGTEHSYTSGRDSDAYVARDVGRAAGVFPASGTVATVEHVEVKVAARMRAADLTGGVLVINNPRGPRPGQQGRLLVLHNRPEAAAPAHYARGVVADSRSGPAHPSDVHRRRAMTRLLGGKLLRSDLLHADEPLFPSAAFELRHASVAMTMHDAEGMSFLLDSVLDPAAAPTTVSLQLKPRDYRPDELSPPEFPPSNLLVRVGQRHGVAAAALLAFDRDHRSHQWLAQGDAWRDGVATLPMDPANGEDTPFPPEAYISVPQLHKVIAGWAWGTELPPAGVPWREAGEAEVRWSWF